MLIERTFGIESFARQVFDEFAICFKDSAIGTGKMHAAGMISQCLVCHPASNRITDFVLHQKANAVLL
jgi:hypothetical protein